MVVCMRGLAGAKDVTKIVLVRHGQSEWNLTNRFTGWADVPMTEYGRRQARALGKALRKEKFHALFTSRLKRARETLDLIIQEIGADPALVVETESLNERHYGDLQGLYENEAFQRIGLTSDGMGLFRRSFQERPPGGESLEDTSRRVLSFFENDIASKFGIGKNTLIVAHANSLLMIVMYLEGLEPQEAMARQLMPGTGLVYEIRTDGTLMSKNVLVSGLE